MKVKDIIVFAIIVLLSTATALAMKSHLMFGHGIDSQGYMYMGASCAFAVITIFAIIGALCIPKASNDTIGYDDVHTMD